MLLCIVKIRLFRVKSTGFHIINVASGHPHTKQGQLGFYWGKVGKKEVIKQRQVNHLFIHIIGIELVFYICSMMNKCLCENVFTLGATIETNAIYIYIDIETTFTLLCLHINNRELQRKKKTKPVLPFCAIYKIWQYSSRPAYKGWKEQQRKEKQLCLEMQLNLRDVKGYWRWEGKVIHREACEEPQKMQWKHWDFAFLPKDESIWCTWW